MSPAVGIAGPSGISVRAGARVVEAGGNAVDAAVAATLAALCTEVAIVGLDAAAYVTIWRPDESPVVIDGGIAMPGLGRTSDRVGAAGRPVTVDYGGGTHTIVGYGAVGVGGAVAALGEAALGWGGLCWADLVAPAEHIVRAGFPLSSASHSWLKYSHETIFGWQPESAAVIHDAAGELLPAGGAVWIPGLAETLAELGRDGPGSFYEGRLGAAIAACVDAGGGLMSQADRGAYRAERCQPVRCAVDGWSIAVPPPPAVGGAAMAAMLARMDGLPEGEWTPGAIAALAAAQRDVFEFLASADRRPSASTVHISALDADGLACSITASSGYGSGVLVPGAGIWLNNCLGELELNPKGFHALAPGQRMASNMSPAIARSNDGAMLALGSPGAERITTALLQVILNFIRLGLPLEDAIAAPRLHVERGADGWQAAVEPGLPLEAMVMACRQFEERSMFFGGAGAVLRDPDGALIAAADPRRQGAAMVMQAGRSPASTCGLVV
jgi:gamma-glutamyltranspeptidase / glutathione hydrolase